MTVMAFFCDSDLRVLWRVFYKVLFQVVVASQLYVSLVYVWKNVTITFVR